MEIIINNIQKDPYNYSKNLDVKKLEQVIKYTADKFFNDESVISDSIYDLLIDFLRYKDPKNKVLKNIGTKVKSKNKVKLDYHLGSMDKIKPPSKQLEKWLNEYKPEYILSDKLDGVSALLTYKKNGNITLHTRGTATYGVDITPILKYISKIPSFENINKFIKKENLISSNKNNLIAFRGELIISKEIFNDKWKEKKSNARNTVSGLVNSKNINPHLATSTYFVVYEIIDPFLKLSKQFELIEKVGLRTVHNKVFKSIDYDKLSKYLLKRKKNSKYEIDGIIVSNNEKHIRNIKGNPDYAFAFKDILEEQKATSTIENIEWNISKDGYINPTVVIIPVEIGGVTISRVTAYNAKYVVDNKLGKGAVIELIRSGDVIPKITKIIQPAKKIDFPDIEWRWTKTKVDIITDKINCKDAVIKSIHYFFSSLDTKGLGEKVIEKLYDSGLTTIYDILNANKEDLLKVDGIKDKSATNLINSIKKSITNNGKGIELSLLMSASNKLGHGMGKERSKLVLDKFPNIINLYNKWSRKEFINNLKNIPGWEEKTSTQFVDNFPKFMDFYKKIKKFIILKEKSNDIKIKKSKYTDKTIVLSGFRDKDIEEKFKEHGAKITTSISKNTDILIVKDQSTINENTGKVKKAKELNIKIITKDNVNFSNS